MARVRQEQLQVQAQHGAAISATAMGAMPYTEAVVREAWRLHPIVPVTGRRSREVVSLGPFQLPAEQPTWWVQGRLPGAGCVPVVLQALLASAGPVVHGSGGCRLAPALPWLHLWHLPPAWPACVRARVDPRHQWRCSLDTRGLTVCLRAGVVVVGGVALRRVALNYIMRSDPRWSGETGALAPDAFNPDRFLEPRGQEEVGRPVGGGERGEGCHRCRGGGSRGGGSRGGGAALSPRR
jgi:hypothetical protein